MSGPRRPSLATALGVAAAVAACGGADTTDRPPAAGAEAGPPTSLPTWEVVHQDPSMLVIGLSIVDDTTVWISGGDGLVGRTTDGGATWTFPTVPGGESLGFRDVHAFSADEAFLLSIGEGTDSRIYHTADGGASWTPSFRNDDPDAFYDCFSFWDARRGIAFSDSHEGEFTLLRTLDGGASWHRIDPAAVPDARPGEGAFASSGTCVVTRPGGLGWFVTGASGVDTRVVRTTDHGDTWSDAVTPVRSVSGTSGIFSLSMVDDRRGVVVGGGLDPADSLPMQTAFTDDGGRTWREGAPTGMSGAAYGVAWVPGTASPGVLVVSPDGSALSTDRGATWTRLDRRDYWTVAARGSDAVWAGGRGHVSRLRPGG